MSQLVPTNIAAVILPDGEIVQTTYQATGRVLCMADVLEDAKRSLQDFDMRVLVDPKDWHQFRVIDGRCRNCGISRAEFEFSRRTIACVA